MDTKKLLAVLVSVAMCGAAFAGCGNNADSSKAESKAESSSSQVEKMPETDEEWTQAMYDKAMVSYGNTSMMQNVIKKAQSGEKVTVAYLGGSITEGISAGADGCYAKLTYDYFAQKFGTGDNVQYVNAGLSGTPSKLGILRLDRDVLAYEPDICFIEFAVNDGTYQFLGCSDSITKKVFSFPFHFTSTCMPMSRLLGGSVMTRSPSASPSMTRT